MAKELIPSHMPIILGTRYAPSWAELYPFTLSMEDRRRHMYVVGQTGTGKSTLLKDIIKQDIWAGRGVGYIDPHGQDAEEFLRSIPSWRANDVVYLGSAHETDGFVR
jgi:ABC-type ATPase involved in cell division